MTDAALERRNRERAILRLLWNRPLCSSELYVLLRLMDEIPREWRIEQVRVILRRLHARGTLSRLDCPPVSRSCLWWAH